MAKSTNIAWCRSSWNPWIGCTEVSLEVSGGGGCDHCYAREIDARRRWGGTTHFGVGVPRHRTGTAYWRQAEKWNRQAEHEQATGILWNGRAGFWPVFPSLCDPFDNEVPDEWRADLWRLIRATPALTWLLLTKRIGNVETMRPGGTYPNVWIGASIVNQKEADRDVPKLLAVNGFAKRFISYEPALGPVVWPGFNSYTSWCPICKQIVRDTNPPHEETHGIDIMAEHVFDPARHCQAAYDLIHQIIAGGESGPRARPPHPDWFRSLRDQCSAAGVAFFFKQWGQFLPRGQRDANGEEWTPVGSRQRPARDDGGFASIGKKRAGNVLDGRTHMEFPT